MFKIIMVFLLLDLVLYVGNDYIYGFFGKLDLEISEFGYEIKYCRLIIN